MLRDRVSDPVEHIDRDRVAFVDGYINVRRDAELGDARHGIPESLGRPTRRLDRLCVGECGWRGGQPEDGDRQQPDAGHGSFLPAAVFVPGVSDALGAACLTAMGTHSSPYPFFW